MMNKNLRQYFDDFDQKYKDVEVIDKKFHEKKLE